MKKILISVLVVTFCLISTTPAFSADELIYETFDDWKNPNVAEGWRTHSVGGWGGEYNQIYEAAQEMTCGPGESTYYRSIYKDFSVVPGKLYSVMFDPLFSGTWHGWLQFYDAQNQLLSTVGNFGIEYGKGYLPARITWISRDSIRHWGQEAVAAPDGASRMRLVFQVHPGGAVAVRNVALYEAHQADVSGGRVQYNYQKIAGPFINRNTEFVRGINNQLGTHTFGTLTGEYKIRPVAGSSQGISSGGTFNDYKMLYKDFRVTEGQRYKLSVDVISNSTNENGTRAPSPVRIWLQYNGPKPTVDGPREMVLATHGIDGTQAGIKDNEWTTVTVPGPSGELYIGAPEWTNRARIILQVMGGTGAGTIFDNVSFTRYEN